MIGIIEYNILFAYYAITYNLKNGMKNIKPETRKVYWYTFLVDVFSKVRKNILRRKITKFGQTSHKSLILIRDVTLF